MEDGMMDLLELNDIYCKDKTRIEKNNIFSNDVKALYNFTPTEDSLFGSNEPVLNAVVIHPFNGAACKKFNHDLAEFNNEIMNTPITSNYGYPWDDMRNKIMTNEDFVKIYEMQKACYPMYHLDLGFSDVIPGITMVMSMVRNCNTDLLRYAGLKTELPTTQISEFANGSKTDTRSLSLIYVDGDLVLYGYGTILIFGSGLRSLPNELCMYLLSNTYIVGKNSKLTIEDKDGTSDITTYDRMKTACIIIYKDSICRILDNMKEEI